MRDDIMSGDDDDVHDLQVEAIDKLHNEVKKLETQAVNLVEEIRKSDVKRRRDRVVFAVSGVLTLVIFVLLSVIAVGNKSVVNQIHSCTTPTGECYRRGQADTGRRVDQLSRITIYVAECARVTKTDAALESCVSKRVGVEDAAR